MRFGISIDWMVSGEPHVFIGLMKECLQSIEEKYPQRSIYDKLELAMVLYVDRYRRQQETHEEMPKMTLRKR